MLSLCMIVRNEESNLPRLFENVRGLPDESIVVDTGSTDRTVEIARAHGARVETFPWIDDFAAARNHALSFARGEWILVLDADDELERADVPLALERLARSRARALSVRQTIPYPGVGTFEKRQLAFLRNRPDNRYVFRVHETVPMSAEEMEHTEVRVRHLGYTPDLLPEKQARNRRLLERMKQDPGALDRAAALYYLGCICENERRLDAAFEEFAGAAYAPVACDFRDYAALGLARISAERGDVAFARAVYAAVLDARPGAVEAELGLADVCLRQEIREEAVRHFDTANRSRLRILPYANDPWEQQVRRRLGGLLAPESA